MSTFRTTLPPFIIEHQIDHEAKVLTMGSCFAEHIAQKLLRYKFKCTVNPFGILYNPLNISDTIIKCLQGYSYSEKDLLKRDGMYYSWWHHSQINKETAASLLSEIQNIQESLLDKIRESKLFIFTFGTAYYYQHQESGFIVGNCHKSPSSTFNKLLASSNQIAESYHTTLNEIKKINPEAKFVFTVSPVRHIKDGIIENTRSKSTLHLALANITDGRNDATYFPAYEIMMDDLRDYRFYKSDLLHPNGTAIDYIWDHFTENLFSKETKSINKEIDKIHSAISHRPFNPYSEAHQTFLKNTLNSINQFQNKYNFIDFKNELNRLENQLL